MKTKGMLSKKEILGVVMEYGFEIKMEKLDFIEMVKEEYELMEDLHFVNKEECRAFLRKHAGFLYRWLWDLR